MSESTSTDRIEATKVRERFGDSLFKVKSEFGEMFLCVNRDIVPSVLEFLRDELGFNYFSECVGVDYSKWENARDFDSRFEVVYNLISTSTYDRIFVKTGVNDGETIPTSKHVFLGAEYPEREVNDLLGIIFEGNEQTTRFLLPDDWIGFPLRKEFPLGGEDVLFDKGSRGPAVEDVQMPHAGESFEGKTGSEDLGGR